MKGTAIALLDEKPLVAIAPVAALCTPGEDELKWESKKQSKTDMR